MAILIALVGVFATHFLTLWREKRKRRDEVLGEWRKGCKTLLREVVDAAIAHYTDPKSVEVTTASAQQILTNLQRFGLDFRRSHCTVLADKARAATLARDIKNLITFPDDFQNTGRQIRDIDDKLTSDIRDLEAEIIRVIDAKRVMRD